MAKQKVSATIASYLAARFFGSVVSTTVVLTAIILVVDGIELLRKLGKAGEVESGIALQLLFFKLPELVLQLAPFIILISTMLCFTRLTKNQEFTALRASGMPARTFLFAPVLVCLAIGLFNTLAFNPFAATMLHRYEKLYNEVFPGSASGLVTEGGSIWLKQETADGAEIIIHAESVHDRGRKLENAIVFRFSLEGSFIERLNAKKMLLEKNNWRLLDVLKLKKCTTQGERQAQLIMPTSLTTEMIQNSFTSPNTLSVWELPRFIKLLKETGFATHEHELHWQRQLATPALIIAMFILAAPFGLYFSRSFSAAPLLLAGIGIGLGFYLFTNFIGAYGLAGRLSISIAAWTPTLIAGLLGASLFLHFREE